MPTKKPTRTARPVKRAVAKRPVKAAGKNAAVPKKPGKKAPGKQAAPKKATTPRKRSAATHGAVAAKNVTERAIQKAPRLAATKQGVRAPKAEASKGATRSG